QFYQFSTKNYQFSLDQFPDENWWTSSEVGTGLVHPVPTLKPVASWAGDSEDYLGHTPSIYLDGHSARRITFTEIVVQEGDMLEIVGMPNGIEPAPLDYVVFLPKGAID
ncbi:hypothetical protein KCU87_g10052, partial [Aureobasidium melanogenum]